MRQGSKEELGEGSQVGRPFHILSLDGGGIKGLFSASILASFEERFSTKVVDHFDLVVGTSTGGIIALALGARFPLSEVVNLYGNLGDEVFRRRVLAPLTRISRPRYNADHLHSALESAFGGKQLWESCVPLVIPAYNLRTDDARLYKTPHHERLSEDWGIGMVDVAMATSAAPTYFRAHQHDGARLIDGGIWANNPILIGIAEAVSMFGTQLEDIRVLSLGTMRDAKYRPTGLDRGGCLQWGMGGIDVVMQAQSIGAHNIARHLLGHQPGELERVTRINPIIPPGILGLDKPEVAELKGRANAAARENAPLFEKYFLRHTTPHYEPLHRPSSTGKGPSIKAPQSRAK